MANMHKWSKYSLTSDTIGTYEEIYEDLFIFDSHTHIGLDKDGSRLGVKNLVKSLKDSNINRAVVFPMDDPNDFKHFTKPNNAILEAAKKYKDLLVPFFRLNPNFEWQDEFARCLSQGFKGIKLHPRSQKFDIDNEKVMEVYEWAQEEKLPVLIHLGTGTEESNISAKLKTVIKKFPKLKIILGHGAFIDLDNVTKKIGKSKNIVFEMSTMKIFDILTLMSNVSEKKLVFGSDIPYYDIDISLEAVIDTAIMLNKSPKHIQDMLGKNLLRWFPV